MRRGIVSVIPWAEPAKVMVAPNSPRQRARARAVPLARPGTAMGRVTHHRTREGPAPRAAAVSSNPRERVRRAASSVMTRKGRETKTWAMTTAAVEKATEIPMACMWAPSTPLRPKAVRSARPATTGGSERGSATRIRAARTPRHSRDSRIARGTPTRTSTTTAARHVLRLSFIAATVDSFETIPGRSDQGTRIPMKTRGRTR